MVRLTVLTELPPPLDAIPTATQLVGPAQDTEAREETGGDVNVVHALPLVVPTIAGSALTTPTATHVVEFSHDTLAKELRLAGGVCVPQVEPSIVLTISVPPTAVHSVGVTQEIDCGGNDES